jgi:hypothetical protein
MDDNNGPLPFTCPHCFGPLQVTADGDVECKHKHRFKVSEVMQEQTRTSSKATWLAVKALQERAETSRWAARDPELYGIGDAQELEASAAEDERNAGVLQKQAQMLDLTLWRIIEATDGDGAPL